MNELYPKPDSPESLAGTAAHWVWQQLLAGQSVVEGEVAPNGTVIDDEMLEGAGVMLAAFNSLGITDPNVEMWLNISRIHPRCYGTPDVWFYDEHAQTLHVVDYKFGHRFVSEIANDQLLCYTVGALDVLAASWGLGVYQSTTVKLTVVQPRCYVGGAAVRTWTTTAYRLDDQIESLRRAADASMVANPVATVNSECRDCPGKHACPALQQAAYSDAEFSEVSPPVELSTPAASLELRYIERALARMEARADGLREQLVARAKSGELVPHYRLQQGYGRTVWGVPTEQVLVIGQMYGVDLSKTGTITPAQAKKAGIDESVIKAYSSTPLGAIKLVPDDSTDAARVFGETKHPERG
jgi:hypothetical protein